VRQTAPCRAGRGHDEAPRAAVPRPRPQAEGHAAHRVAQVELDAGVQTGAVGRLYAHHVDAERSGVAPGEERREAAFERGDGSLEDMAAHFLPDAGQEHVLGSHEVAGIAAVGRGGKDGEPGVAHGTVGRGGKLGRKVEPPTVERFGLDTALPLHQGFDAPCGRAAGAVIAEHAAAAARPWGLAYERSVAQEEGFDPVGRGAPVAVAHAVGQGFVQAWQELRDALPVAQPPYVVEPSGRRQQRGGEACPREEAHDGGIPSPDVDGRHVACRVLREPSDALESHSALYGPSRGSGSVVGEQDDVARGGPQRGQGSRVAAEAACRRRGAVEGRA